MVNANEFSTQRGATHETKGDLFQSTDVADFDVPRGKDEIWRFTPLRRLRGLHKGEFSTPVAQKIDVTTPACPLRDRRAGR